MPYSIYNLVSALAYASQSFNTTQFQKRDKIWGIATPPMSGLPWATHPMSLHTLAQCTPLQQPQLFRDVPFLGPLPEEYITPPSFQNFLVILNDKNFFFFAEF